MSHRTPQGIGGITGFRASLAVARLKLPFLVRLLPNIWQDYRAIFGNIFVPWGQQIITSADESGINFYHTGSHAGAVGVAAEPGRWIFIHSP